MTGNILKAARKLTNSIMSKSGFTEMAVLCSPDKSISIEIRGVASKPHIAIDSDGLTINSKNAKITFSESSLVNYPLRNSKGEIDLRGHIVKVPDSTEVVKTYSIEEYHVNETLGYVVCFLTDHKE